MAFGSFFKSLKDRLLQAKEKVSASKDNFLATRNTKKESDILKQGGEINYTPRSDRYSYDIPDDTNYDKKWKPKTKEEFDTLSPKGFHRIGDRLAEKKKRKGTMSEDDFDKNFIEKQVSIDSTALSNVQYNPKDKILSVRFQSGKKQYSYPDVTQEQMEAFMKAPSKGEYFMSRIHDQNTLNPGHKPSGNYGVNYRAIFDAIRRKAGTKK